MAARCEYTMSLVNEFHVCGGKESREMAFGVLLAVYGSYIWISFAADTKLG